MDVSQRRTAEQEIRSLQAQLYQSQRMATIGMLTGGVAHSFNNGLQAISGYAELALLQPDLPVQARAYVQKVLAMTRRSANITAKLLAFSRHDVTGADLFDLRAAVRSAQGTLEPRIGDEVAIRTCLQTPCPVAADRIDIEEMIVNLVLNAQEAMPKGGTVTIEVDTPVEPPPESIGALRAPRPGGYASLVVRDTGIGMTPEVAAQVFNPFYSTKGAGVGLGLALSHGAVKQAGGYISVASEVGVGTSFTVYLPRGTAAAGAETHEQGEST